VNDTLRDEVIKLHAHICNGLADPIRILILYSLAEKRQNVSELANNLNIPQPTVSRHLKVLRDRNMVLGERSGQSVYLTIANPQIITALDILRNVLAETLESQGNLAQSAAASRKYPVD
jgi:ArsR family transcriptional regulator